MLDVIGVGFGRTGTASLKAALEQVGFGPCYHGFEVLQLRDALAAQLSAPFALFGHSMGALIAFELVRELRRCGLPQPRLLVVSGRPAPQLLQTRPALHSLPTDELLARLREIGGAPEEVLESPDLLELVLRPLRADLALCETHDHVEGPPLDCPVMALAGRRDPLAGVAEVDRWREETQGRFQMHTLGGDHFFVQTAREQVWGLLARELLSPPAARASAG